MASTQLYGQVFSQAFGTNTGGSAPNIDWVSDAIYVALVTSSYTPDIDAHDFWNDVSANELATGNGYTTNGVAVTSPTITYVGASNRTDFDFADPSWTFTASKTFRYAVVYDRTPATDATRPLLAYIDFGSDQSISTAFSIQLSTSPSALFTVTV